MLLSFQTGFGLVNVAVVVAILESISGLEPSTVLVTANCTVTVSTAAGVQHCPRLITVCSQ